MSKGKESTDNGQANLPAPYPKQVNPTPNTAPLKKTTSYEVHVCTCIFYILISIVIVGSMALPLNV